jgi:hypothetical protein
LMSAMSFLAAQHDSTSSNDRVGWRVGGHMWEGGTTHMRPRMASGFAREI